MFTRATVWRDSYLHKFMLGFQFVFVFVFQWIRRVTDSSAIQCCNWDVDTTQSLASGKRTLSGFIALCKSICTFDSTEPGVKCRMCFFFVWVPFSSVFSFWAINSVFFSFFLSLQSSTAGRSNYPVDASHSFWGKLLCNCILPSEGSVNQWWWAELAINTYFSL